MPLDNTRFKVGNYSLEVGNDKFTKGAVSAQLSANLNSPSELTVRVAMKPQDLRGIALGDLPKDASLKWSDRGLFKGKISGARYLTSGAIELTFRDDLIIAQKTVESAYVKKQSLQETLQKMATKAGLPPKFSGSFSDEVTAYNQSDVSIFDHWQKLGLEFGFHFVMRSFSNQLQFIKLGESVQAVSVDVQKQVTHLISSHSSDLIHESADLFFFDPQDHTTKEKKLSQDDLYAPLGTLKSHAGFKDKQQWGSAKGSVEETTSTKEQFEKGDKAMKSRLSKLAVGGDSVTLTAFEPLALPGDMMSLSNSNLSSALEGKFLVQSTRIAIDGSRPKAEIVGVRG